MEKLTLKKLFDSSVNKFHDRTALSGIDTNIYTYADVDNKVKEIQKFLSNSGVAPGDAVAILSENSPNWGIAFFAVTTMGAIAVPILPDFSEGEVKHILKHSGSKAVFISERYSEKIEGFQSDVLNTYILLDDFSILPPMAKIDKIRLVINEGKKEFAKIRTAALKFVGILPEEVEEDNIASIIYTSGTTGHSKGVMLTHKNLVFDAAATCKIVKVLHEDRLLSILPLSHTYECTLGLVLPFMQGASVYYIDKAPTANVLIPAMAKVKPTVMLSVPLVIEKIFKLRVLPQITSKPLIKKLYKLSVVRKKINKLAGKKLLNTFGGKLRLFCIGGAAISADVEKFLREAEFPYAIGYGLTETSPLVTGTDSDKTFFRSAGKPIPGVEVKIVNPNKETGEGEIYIKGPNVMKGYFKDPERTQQVLTSDGWFNSGDLGVINDKGYLLIKGRMKNVVVGSSGENIYPEEIESIIDEIPWVLESLVYEYEGEIIARVHLNYEEIEKDLNIEKQNESQARKKIDEVLKIILEQVNEKVAKFSRLNRILEQPEPFEKTPTQKIKRYLYVQ